MKAILLHNWKAKFTSLLLAVAIWFLIRHSIQDQLPLEIPVPGEAPKVPVPSIKTPPPVPGLPGTVGGISSADREDVFIVAGVAFFRLQWIETGEFEASPVEDPARAII